MQETNQQYNGITHGVIWKQLLLFFFPIMLGTLFQQLYNTVDAVVVGQFVNKEALAAVGGSSAQVLNLIIGFFSGVSSGATVLVAQYYGARDEAGISKAVHTGMLLAIAGGGLMMILGLLLAPTMLKWMNTPADTIGLSSIYLRIIFLSVIPSMIYNMGSAILRAVGDSRRPLLFLILCCLLNIALDLLFVLVFSMGVEGVAIATAIAQCFSAALVWYTLQRSSESYRLQPKKLRFDWPLLKRTVQIGLPTGLQSMMYALSNTIITVSINGFGTNTVAAWVAMGKVDALDWMLQGAFGISVMTFVGQNYGAGRYDRVMRSMRVCLLMCCGCILTFSALFLSFGEHIFRLFTSDAQVLEIALEVMRHMAPFYCLYVPIEIISGSLRGMGHTLIPTLITLFGICVLRALWMSFIVPRWHEVSTVAISYPISWLLTALAFVFYFLYYRRKHLVPLLQAQKTL